DHGPQEGEHGRPSGRDRVESPHEEEWGKSVTYDAPDEIARPEAGIARSNTLVAALGRAGCLLDERAKTCRRERRDRGVCLREKRADDGRDHSADERYQWDGQTMLLLPDRSGRG